jgi:hypothetical protein
MAGGCSGRSSRVFVVGASILALLLPGCTRVQSFGLDAAKPAPGALPAGFTYWLPQSDVAMKAGLVLTDCPVAPGFEALDSDAAGDAKPPPVTAMGFALSGSITPGTKRGQQVQLDYRKMVDFLKTGSLAVERHPNGMLKTVNAELNDESPEAIAALAKVGVAVASLSVGGPALPVAALGTAAASNLANQLLIQEVDRSNLLKGLNINNLAKFALLDDLKRHLVADPITETGKLVYQSCTPEAFRLLAEYRTLKAQADALDADIEKAVATAGQLLEKPGTLRGTELATLVGIQATLKDRVNKKTSVDEKMAANVAARTLALKATGTLPAAVSFAPATQEVTDAYLERLFVNAERDVQIPRDVQARAASAVPAAADGLGRIQLTVLGKDGFRNSVIVTDGVAGLVMRMAKAEAVVAPALAATPLQLPQACARVRPGTTMPLGCADGNGKPILNDGEPATLAERLPPGHARFGDGIVYVEPRRAGVTMSGPALTIRADSAGLPRRDSRGGLAISFNDKGFERKTEAAFPEYGQHWILPLTSGFGQKSGLEATFAEDGSLLKGKFGRTASAGKAIASTAQTVAEQWLAARVAKEAREIAVYENQTKLLQAQKTYNSNASPTPPTAEDPIDAEIKALTKQRDLRLAKLAIIEVDKKILESQAAANNP